MIGNIILLENTKQSFFPKCIKFFTKKLAKKNGVKAYTHTMFCMPDYCGYPSVLSAETALCIMPLSSFEVPEYNFDMYSINDNISESDLNELFSLIYARDAGKVYGFFQNVWFIYRWFMELFGKDVRKQKNWFPASENCSENVYNYLYNRFKKTNRPEVSYLEEWNNNSFSPVDMAIVIKKLPYLFTKVYSWGN